MKRQTLIALALWQCVFTSGAAAKTPASDTQSKAAFDALSSLVGTWEGRFSDGRVHQVVFRTIANGSVLVENWQLSPTRQSMTVYHRDGARLLATHYCPQGNAPRLQLISSAADKMSFAFVDGANLKVKGASHQHTFWIKVIGPDSFARAEYYVENGARPALIKESPDDVIVYTRVPKP